MRCMLWIVVAFTLAGQVGAEPHRLEDERIAALGEGTPDAVVHVLAEALGDASLPAKSRREICRYLSFIGGSARSVEALAAAMNDSELRPVAIQALAGIPARPAVLALLKPLISADPDTQMLLLNALAANEKTSEVRGAVGTFYDLARSEDERVRAIAIELLGRMPYANTLRALKPLVEEDAPGALRATLALAGGLLDAGKAEDAEQALGVVTAHEHLSVPLQCEVLHLQGRLGTEGAREAVFKALHSEHARIRAAVLDACVALPGRQATAALGLLMAEADDKELKIGLLNVLGQRGDTMVDTAAALINAAATHEDDDVKIAAIGAIEAAQLVAPAVSTLILLLEKEEGLVRAQAGHALSHLKSKAVGTWIARAVPNAEPETKAVLLRVLGQRGETEALPVVLDAARSEDVNVRIAAYEALGQLPTVEAFEVLMNAFCKEEGAARDAARQAMLRFAGQPVESTQE